MDLRSHFAAIWRYKWVTLSASVLVAACVFVALSLQSKTYEASAELNVNAGQSASNSSGLQDVTPFLAQTYAQLAQTRPVLADAARRSGLHISESTAAQRISTQTPGDIGLIELSATGPSPQAAVDLARGASGALVAAVASQQRQALQAQVAPLQNEINQLTNQLNSPNLSDSQRSALESQYQTAYQALYTAEAQPTNSLSIVSPAEAGSSPVAPKPKSYALLAFLTALVVLAELSVAYEIVTDRLSKTTGDDELRRLTGLPVLARIPRGSEPELVEAFRTLRTSLLFMNGSGGTRSMAIVSSGPDVGKSFISINLAKSFADLGLRAMLIDCDMRRPAVAGRLGLPGSPGASEALRGGELSAGLTSVSTESGRDLYVLPAGAPAPDPAGLLTGGFAKLLGNLGSVDALVVDTPADSLFPDASIIAARCDATVVVIDANSTRRRSLQGLLQHLKEVGGHPAGIVVNRAQDSAKSSRYYYRPDSRDEEFGATRVADSLKEADAPR
jgi:polysaccharide biosynthesis transport protein